MFGLDKKQWDDLNGLYTANEIVQQPELWLETIKIVEKDFDKIDIFLKEKLKKKSVRVIFTGAGTSAYIGDIITPYFNKRKFIYESIPTTDIVANPTSYFKKEVPTILVSFARSGNSPESLASYNLANQLIDDVNHIFITCNKDGHLADIAKNKDNILLILMPEESNDRGFAMTSSFSCMTLTSLLIFDLENFSKNKKEVIKMIGIGRNILESGYKQLEEIISYGYERVAYLGTGSLHGIAKESALKLLELTRGQIVSYSESILGFRHGPKSIVNDKTLVFMYLSMDPYSRKYDMDLLKEIYRDSGDHKIIAISSIRCNEVDINSHNQLYLTEEDDGITNEGFISLLYVLFAQIFALKYSIRTDVEPDNPNPNGLVNRVVKGVKIYKYQI
ncbi:SIS domain-containing protein [Tissierella sp. MSJ-40]|uniref:SIS domain-containing protein n=1 Tax=Tissierella simiarum TaxID=2841534 RepID=A0ABS6E6A0_9FIRM|nr:SIS domain-containing protein [Tissierella simiarum]MBU5437950.1 SIS domain-containing protein [Tissierella simiarum]